MIERLNIPKGAQAQLYPCAEQLWGGKGMHSMFRHRCSRLARFHCTNCTKQYCRAHLLKNCPHSGQEMTDQELQRYAARTIPKYHDSAKVAEALTSKGCAPDQIETIIA